MVTSISVALQIERTPISRPIEICFRGGEMGPRGHIRTDPSKVHEVHFGEI
jgi:hypothetical protein